jgi:hypothetical protein
MHLMHLPLMMENKMAKTTANAFQFNEIVSVQEQYGLSSRCYKGNFLCIDRATVRLIKTLAGRRTLSPWREDHESVWERVKPSTLCVWKTERGWFAARGTMWKSKMLSHQLNDLPLLFPTPTIAKAAAELCVRPRPNPKLGWMWWGVPPW